MHIIPYIYIITYAYYTISFFYNFNQCYRLYSYDWHLREIYYYYYQLLVLLTRKDLHFTQGEDFASPFKQYHQVPSLSPTCELLCGAICNCWILWGTDVDVGGSGSCSDGTHICGAEPDVGQALSWNQLKCEFNIHGKEYICSLVLFNTKQTIMQIICIVLK